MLKNLLISQKHVWLGHKAYPQMRTGSLLKMQNTRHGLRCWSRLQTQMRIGWHVENTNTNAHSLRWQSRLQTHKCARVMMVESANANLYRFTCWKFKRKCALVNVNESPCTLIKNRNALVHCMLKILDVSVHMCLTSTNVSAAGGRKEKCNLFRLNFGYL